MATTAPDCTVKRAGRVEASPGRSMSIPGPSSTVTTTPSAIVSCPPEETTTSSTATSATTWTECPALTVTAPSALDGGLVAATHAIPLSRSHVAAAPHGPDDTLR